MILNLTNEIKRSQNNNYKELLKCNYNYYNALNNSSFNGYKILLLSDIWLEDEDKSISCIIHPFN